ncbi:MAG: hypothetical protein WBB08_05165 [Halobacteriota archaeon]
MAESAEISDGFLINNLYKILYNEYGEGGFKDIFEKIGISSEIERGDIGDEQVKRIQEWIDKQDEMQNKQIKLIVLLEQFRKVSDNEKEFDRQLEIAEKIYEPLIEVIVKRMTDSDIMGRVISDYKVILKFFKDTQKYAFRTKEFKRDNITHQIRVFLLGCYILYEDPDFWVKRIQEDFNKIIRIREINYSYSFKDILEAWAIASLFHDIGRPIEDAKEALKFYKNTYNFEKIRRFREISFTCDVKDDEKHRFKEIPLLIKLDNLAVEVIVNLIGLAKDASTTKSIEKKVRNLDHGAVGAILCINLDSKVALRALSHRPSLIPMALESLVAIALHDNCKFFFCSALTQLLIFSDELQEWNRVTIIGDREVMIFPCRKIFIKIGEKDDEKLIRAVIPYERPKDMTAQEIFKRFEPMKKWEENRKNFEEATKMGTFQRNFRRGVGLEVHIITNPESLSDVITIAIDGNNGSVAYRKTNIGDIILKDRR